MRAGGSKRTPAEVVSRILREQTFYTIPAAGRQIGLTRTPAYLAAAEGVIPTEKYGKRLLVRRAIWDRRSSGCTPPPVDRSAAPLPRPPPRWPKSVDA